MRVLNLDIETFSSVDIMTSGAYKYVQSCDFEILMCAYAWDSEPVKIIDLTEEPFPKWLIEALLNPEIEKRAWNANFERLCFNAYGIETPVEQWTCDAIKAGYCGLPLSLDGASKALKLEGKGKSAEGKLLIKYFSCPVKSTKVNGGRTRNFPEHAPEKWERFKAYCMQDVEAERHISGLLEAYEFPETERLNYNLDQQINDRGILIDTDMAHNAYAIDGLFSEELTYKVKEITQLQNPNSPAQLKKWLEEKTGLEVPSLAKGLIDDIVKEADCPEVTEVLRLRQMMAKTSTKKYLAMLNCACEDSRAHGLFQFYGANRTGRWAGRLIQMQNLPQNKFKTQADLELARATIAQGCYDTTLLLFDNIPSLLSQLIRTTFVAKEKHIFAIQDFSSIEALIIAWLSGEKWRLEVFATHGKIYEASASVMFGVPFEAVTKESDYRAKGKVAELALGYQGAVGALKTMGGEAMGLSESEMETIVTKWRKANPAIVGLWADLETCAIRAISGRKKVVSKYRGLEFDCDDMALTIKLPSGRKLFYQSPSLTDNKWGKRTVRYKGMDQTTKQWGHVDSYGGKFTENVVQAIARDLLANAMLSLKAAGFDIVAHVHDEVVCEIPEAIKHDLITLMQRVMCVPPEWAKDLTLRADGELTPFYKK